jgi:NAD(P)-dependent dehydrogenase (short-subunit alcohol dehydrogenase family)
MDSTPAQPLSNKTIVIIGGTTGLGLSAAKACFGAGANVVAVGREDEEGRRAAALLGEAAHVFAADAADPQTAPRAIATAARQFGGFHGLYHVAGGSGRSAGDGPLHEITDDGWRRTLDLNLTSLLYSNRAAAKQFLEQGSPGTVLNMSSVLGFAPSPRFFATHAYATAKAAVVGLTTSAASYYAPRGVRFNCIAPALVETRMSARATGDELIMRFIKSKQPLDGGRIAKPEDLDSAVVFFLSDQSRFVTGQVLAVDGGWGVTEGQYPAGG